MPQHPLTTKSFELYSEDYMDRLFEVYPVEVNEERELTQEQLQYLSLIHI